MSTTQRENQALGSAAAVAAARLTSLVAAAVQLPILTRLLEPSDYGKLAVAIAIATYFNVFTDIHTLAFQRFPGKPDERGNYAYAARRVYATVAGIAVVLILAGVLLGGGWRYSLAIAGWGFGITASRFVATAWLGWLKPWSYAGSLAASTTVRTAVLIALVVTTGDADLSLALAGLACGVTALFSGPRLSWRTQGGRPWRLGFGLQLALASAAVTLMNNAALLVLPAIEAPDTVGRFAAMFQLASLTSGAALGLLTTVAYPRLRHAWDSGRQRMVHTALTDTGLLIIATSASVLAVMSAGDYRVARLAVAEGLHEFRLLPSLVIATAVAAMATTTSWEHQLRLQVAPLSRRTVAAAAVGVALLTYLATQFGVLGATVGVIMLQLTYVLFVTPSARRPAQRSATTIGLAVIGLAALLAAPSSLTVTVISATVAAAMGAILLRRVHARRV